MTRVNGKQTKEYTAWINMKRRCLETSQDKIHYFNKGIIVCDEWLVDFKRFLNDVGYAPSKKHEIDRIDNDRGYFKENIRWTTRSVNCFNKIHSYGKKGKLPRGVAKADYGYKAIISINKKQYNLGHFKTPELAKEQYDKVSIEWFGFCREN